LRENKIIFIKNPFHFVNNSNNEIVYDTQNSIDRIKFSELLERIKHVFTNDSSLIIQDSFPLFDILNNTLINKQPTLDNIFQNLYENLKPQGFYERIKGMTSYFGNIKSIMPSSKLMNNCFDSNFLINNNLFRYGKGFSNAFEELYEIRYVNKSQYYDDFMSFDSNSINNQINEQTTQFTKPILSYFGDKAFLFRIANQFIYPNLFHYFLGCGNDGVCTITSTLSMNKQSQFINLDNALTKANDLSKDTHRNKRQFRNDIGFMANSKTNSVELNTQQNEIINDCKDLMRELWDSNRFINSEL
jgi:hypothetical protein